MKCWNFFFQFFFVNHIHCRHDWQILAGPPRAVGSESDCEWRGRWFEPWSGHILPWHTCDISLFQRELPIFCPFFRKSPYQNFRISFYTLYSSLFGISGLPTKIWEFPLSNHSPYLKKKISLFVISNVSHVCSVEIYQEIISMIIFPFRWFKKGRHQFVEKACALSTG